MRFERRGCGGRRFGGSRDRDFGDSDVPKPVKVGEEYDVEISEVGSKGDGIARVKNFVVYVNGAKQGEKAHVKITEVRNRFAVGEKTSGSATEAPAEATKSEEPVVEAQDEGEEAPEEPAEGESEEE